MKLYKVEYRGSYLGGIAFVFAKDEEDAYIRIETDSRTLNFKDVKVTLMNRREIMAQWDGVVHNDNGDY